MEHELARFNSTPTPERLRSWTDQEIIETREYAYQQIDKLLQDVTEYENELGRRAYEL